MDRKPERFEQVTDTSSELLAAPPKVSFEVLLCSAQKPLDRLFRPAYIRAVAAVQQRNRRVIRRQPDQGVEATVLAQPGVTPVTIKAKLIEGPTEAAPKGFEQTVAGLKDGVAQATASFEKTQEKVKEGVEKAMKTAEEMLAFNQGNLEACVKSGQIWAAGVQDLQKQMAASAQASFEETVATFKALSGVKSLKDAFELQSSLARTTLEKTLAESGKLTDASFKLAEQAMAPITARVTMAVEKFAKPV
jgi:phasin family protein